jgi:predicted membrane protein
MLFDLLILILLGAIIYIYVNKYCVDVNASVCTSNFIGSFMHVVKYLGSILLKIIYSAIDIVRKNPYPEPQIKKEEKK